MNIMRGGVVFAPTGYSVVSAPGLDPGTTISTTTVRLIRDINIEARGDKWCVSNGSSTYNRLNEWEYEPQPSSRTDEYLARNRYTLDEAMEIVRLIITKAIGDKP